MNKSMQKSDMHFGEFIALMALLMSLMALSIDIMLPAMTQIGQDLQVAHTNDNQLIISLLFLGFSIGMIFLWPVIRQFWQKTRHLPWVIHCYCRLHHFSCCRILQYHAFG